ncbi:tetratricopeptide repeat protein [Dyadobacter sandarakinus]|uniref:Tetratricopeptide repeat protein n=1 Tax=Dyadobacter sandarakinus TaxID=2747268 RepID=A0ABX7I680_9BACT|nr:tetratricopeptide repeat protein [Dyadobacter sandarakinus]QRR01358.1 tetratricopeptide repeat protein [Dyadobacter sandarakinus]
MNTIIALTGSCVWQEIILMNKQFARYPGLVLLMILMVSFHGAAQTQFLAKAPPEQRLPQLWQYCSEHLISDWDSTASHRFLNAAIATADSLGDNKLKAYAQYFLKCYRVLFSKRYEQYFREGDYKPVVALLSRTKTWAEKNRYRDIAAACEHVTGGVYFRAARYGAAFEHLLLARKAFEAIGYERVPNASGYLFDLGLCYYHFEEQDKALAAFLEATRHPFYVSRIQLNTLNTIGMIYGLNKEWDRAADFYRKTIAQAAAYHDTVWVAIGAGNLGQVFLRKQQPDDALKYLRQSYNITRIVANGAPEDAAYSAIGLALAFTRRKQPDSARYYLQKGRELALAHIPGSTERLDYRVRLLDATIKFNRSIGNYVTAFQLSDTMSVVKDSLRRILDNRIVDRAVEKSEAERYQTELNLLTSQENLSRLRFYVLLATLLGVVTIGTLLFSRFQVRKKRQFELAEKEKAFLALEKKLVEEQLHHAEELLNANLKTLKDKAQLIDSLTTELQYLKESDQQVMATSMATRIEQLVSATILTEEDWRKFRTLFDQTYPGFSFRLREKFPDLSPAETRLLILTKLKLSNYEMAQMLGVSVDAIRKASYRIRKRFELAKEEGLDILIQHVHTPDEDTGSSMKKAD